MQKILKIKKYLTNTSQVLDKLVWFGFYFNHTLIKLCKNKKGDK